TSATLDRELIAYSAYRQAIFAAPSEDFYYLYYGRTLLSIAELVGPEQNKLLKQGLVVDSSIPNNASLDQLPDADYNSLLQNGKIDQTAYNTLAQAFLRQGAFRILNYSLLAMLHARDLSPENKDHYANLGRIYATWYNSLQPKPKDKLDLAIQNYETAHTIAPQ